MARFTVTIQRGPVALGKTGGLWAVRDERTRVVSVYPSGKAAAQRAFENKVANLRIDPAAALASLQARRAARDVSPAAPTPVADAARRSPEAEREYVRAVALANEWATNPTWEDRRVFPPKKRK